MTNDIGRREFLKRGTLAGAVVTSLPAMGPSGPAKLDSVVPVTPGHTSPALSTRRLDSKEFCLSEFEMVQPTLSFASDSVTAATQWQREARTRLIERLGGFPVQRTPLNAEIVETVDLGSYRREKIVFDTRANLAAIGYLLIPKHVTTMAPAVVCFSGHGRGVADILGMSDDGTQRPERGVPYAKEYAIQCVEHGYVTFAVEQLGFGARRDEAARRAGPTENSCRPAACAALLLGQTMAGWRAWDAMRAIDYLATRAEVDAGRIATLGASGGGTTSLMTAAVDTRVKVAVVSAYFNTFRDSIVSISHCPDNYVPGLLHDMEMHDLAGLVAPRALFVESGRNDRIFPVDGSQRAAAKARHIYEVFGTSDRFGFEIHDGAHEFYGAGAFEFLRKAL